MKVCIIANGYPTPLKPQCGCFERDQAVALKSLGLKINFLYIDLKFSFFKHKLKIKHFEEDGINIYGLIGYGVYWLLIVLLSIINYKWSYKFKERLFDKVFSFMLTQNQKPDIIYAHYLYNIAYGVKLKEKYNVPIVGIEHWSALNSDKVSSRVSYLGNTAYQKVDKLISVSNSLANSIYSKFGVKSKIINNMVGEEFVAEYDKKKSSEKMFKYIAIGSLIPRKGFDILIDAFKKAELNKKNCKLIIVGGGSELKNLQLQIDKLSLNDNIVLVGRKNKQEIISLLKESNAFVLSSRSETFSVVCIEAMAMGLPVVATACGGPEEFVTKDVGILVKPSDLQELADGMKEMYDHYYMYDSNIIKNYCYSRFAPNIIAKQLYDIFNETIKNYGNE